jgi:two-component system OmpR family response regulator
VEVYISYLRKKIDTPFDLRTLITVRGMGYRLMADETDDADQSTAHANS